MLTDVWRCGRAEGQWTRMNDGVTYPTSAAKVRSEAAYMLFYCRTAARTYTPLAVQVGAATARTPPPLRPRGYHTMRAGACSSELPGLPSC